MYNAIILILLVLCAMFMAYKLGYSTAQLHCEEEDFINKMKEIEDE